MVTKVNMFATSSLMVAHFPFGHCNFEPMTIRASATVSKVATQNCESPDVPTLVNAFHGGGKPFVER